MVWDEEAEEGAWSEDAPAEDWNAISPELAYIHDTIVEAMSGLSGPAA